MENKTLLNKLRVGVTLAGLAFWVFGVSGCAVGWYTKEQMKYNLEEDMRMAKLIAPHNESAFVPLHLPIYFYSK